MSRCRCVTLFIMHQRLQQRLSAPLRRSPPFFATPFLSLRRGRSRATGWRESLSRQQESNGAAEFADYRIGELPGTPPPQRQHCLLMRRAEVHAPIGANPRLVRRFPPGPLPPVNPTRFGAQALIRASRSSPRVATTTRPNPFLSPKATRRGRGPAAMPPGRDPARTGRSRVPACR